MCWKDIDAGRMLQSRSADTGLVAVATRVLGADSRRVRLLVSWVAQATATLSFGNQAGINGLILLPAESAATGYGFYDLMVERFGSGLMAEVWLVPPVAGARCVVTEVLENGR